MIMILLNSSSKGCTPIVSSGALNSTHSLTHCWIFTEEHCYRLLDANARRTVTSIGNFLFKHGVVTWSSSANIIMGTLPARSLWRTMHVPRRELLSVEWFRIFLECASFWGRAQSAAILSWQSGTCVMRPTGAGIRDWRLAVSVAAASVTMRSGPTACYRGDL